MVQSAVATMASLSMDMKMELIHDPTRIWKLSMTVKRYW